MSEDVTFLSIEELGEEWTDFNNFIFVDFSNWLNKGQNYNMHV